MESLENATVSIYGATPHSGEYEQRKEVLDVARNRPVRHAHMLGLNSTSLTIGMAADYGKIRSINRWIIGKLKRAKKVQVTSYGHGDNP